ncbi:putative hemolysin [Streptohalobacillus salinus]|uniref:Putative hemolysin n=1 Tax=Streptohalobacillus salinus TaxID=621096 RepID=A0A2V3WDM7_9BACI|nr:hemolysin family protein [Streptohalobacillus salinus]PXW92144.1 putative hemolysin [Streptohalobacillus salinus]
MKNIEIIFLIVLILINAFFAASEIALVSLNDNRVNRDAERGDKKAIALKKLLDEPGRFLATIQIGITLAGFLASAFAADSFSEPVAILLNQWGIPLSLSALETISMILITILLSYFTLVIGELVPKQLALQKKEQIANLSVKPLTFLFKISLPVVKLLNVSTNTIVRLFGVDPDAENEEVTEEEIRMMVDIGGEKGTIESSEKQLIHNIFEFNDKDVSDIMTHRTEIEAIPIEATYRDVIDLIKEHRYTRFPVYEEDIDHIIGVLHTKDLIVNLNQSDESFDLKQLMRDPYFVMEHQRIDYVLTEMQKNNIHTAIVVDEYGGTDGLITLEDLIEEIIGEISSEHGIIGQDAEDVIIHSAHEATVKGTIHLTDLNHLLGIDLPVDEYETLNGFLVDQIGFIPTDTYHEPINYENLIFVVKQVTDKRIEVVDVVVEVKHKQDHSKRNKGESKTEA